MFSTLNEGFLSQNKEFILDIDKGAVHAIDIEKENPDENVSLIFFRVTVAILFFHHSAKRKE